MQSLSNNFMTDLNWEKKNYNKHILLFFIKHSPHTGDDQHK